MATSKTSHAKRIISKKNVVIADIKPGDIVEFMYAGKNVYDTRPLVFVLFKKESSKGGKRGRGVKLKRTGQLTGININYLNEFTIEKLLNEDNFLKMKYYSLYKDSFRTYSVSKMKSIKLVEYQTKKQKKMEKLEKAVKETTVDEEVSDVQQPKEVVENPQKPSEPPKP